MNDERRYTLEEAAAEIVLRQDDLAALLPEEGIDLADPGRAGGTLSEDEVARLNELAEQIKQFRQGPYTMRD